MGNFFQKPVNNLSSTTNPPIPVVGNDEKRNEPMTENHPTMILETVTADLKVFTFAELKKATKNFRPDTMAGEGGFGSVFKGWVDGETYVPSSKVGIGIPIAIKKSNSDRILGLKEWQEKVDLLNKFNHPNLVKLLGYCWEDKEFLLVYEYMENGSLQNHLFKRSRKALPWDTRIKIAIQAAQGLVFLQTTQIITIFRDFKSSDILLDKDFNAKLSDFGHANLRPAFDDSCVSTGIVMRYDFGQENLGPANGYPSDLADTYYYADSQYIGKDNLYMKKNVYNFGVVLLEMITGLREINTSRPSRLRNLGEWDRPMLRDESRLQDIIDPRLENNYPSKGASQTSKLILSCLEENPKKRPSMEEVLASLKHISDIKAKS